MPAQKAHAPQHPREGSPRRLPHSAAGSSRMGNRQLGPLRKASGPMSTVGEMIPFQKASRRDPHLTSSQDSRPNLQSRRGQKKSSSEPQERQEGENAQGTRKNGDDSSKSVASVSGQPSPRPHKKPSPPDGPQSQARSVRPKVKRTSFPRELSKTSSFPGSGATRSSSDKSQRGSDLEEVKGHTSTSPRRRIVKRKSQLQASDTRKGGTEMAATDTRKSNNNVQSLNPNIENTRQNAQHSAIVPSERTAASANLSSNGVNNRDIVLSTSARHLSSNGQTLNPSASENQSGSSLNNNDLIPQNIDRTVTQENIRGRTISQENIEMISFESQPQSRPQPQPQPPLSAREALNRSLRSRTAQSRPGNERVAIQPAIASAAEFDRSSSNSPEGQETYPNSVRRSQERLNLDSQGGARLQQDRQGSEMYGRPRLNRQQMSGVTQRARQREIIDVDAAVSVLSRRVPQSATLERTDPETSPSRQGNDARTHEENIWVPFSRRTQHESGAVLENQYTQSSPRTHVSSVSPRESEFNSPEAVFRDSPVAPLPFRRNATRLSSLENEDNTNSIPSPRPSAAIPTRRGLYRALSVTERADSSPEANRTRPTQNTPRTRTPSIYENVDHDDMVSWREIESNHSNPYLESRQRHIYQDRARGRSTIIGNTVSDRRIIPPSVDSVPDLNDTQEFPPLAATQYIRNISSGLVAETRREQAASSGADQEPRMRPRRNETPPPTPIPGQGRNPTIAQSPDDEPPDSMMMEHLVLLASPIFGPLMLQASPAVLFSMLSRARRDFGGEFVELLIENVVLSLLAQHTFDLTINQPVNDSGAPPPATSETIESLEKVTVTKRMVSEDAFCAICHCEYSIGEKLDQLPCKHSFHNQCITIWLKKSGTCPVCRHKLYAESVE